jgi:hypothetical protein
MFGMFEGCPIFSDGFRCIHNDAPHHKKSVSKFPVAHQLFTWKFESSIDRPVRLAEIYVAADHALQYTITNPDLWKSLSPLEEFE